MNNKVLARIVAVVMAIAMLGSISFAASISGDVINVGNLSAAYKAQDQKTVVAYYAAEPDEVNPADEDIIAIYQSDEATDSVKINTAQNTASEGSDRKYLVVKYGGSSVDAQTFAIALNSNSNPVTLEGNTYTIDYGNYEKEFSNVAYFKQEIGALEAGQTIESYGFKLWKANGGATSEAKPLYFTGDTLMEGDGEYSFGIVMVAVPDDVSLAAESFYAVK